MTNNTTENNLDVIDLQRPFQGLLAFAEKNKAQFGGRDVEIKELFQLTKINPLTIVYGKSGTGKTSVLQAGLMPELRNNSFFPIFFRIDYANTKSPLIQLKDSIYEKLKSTDQAIPEFSNKTLWEYFHDLKLSDGKVVPVLILDQFEEIFTLGKDKGENITELITELSDLAENRIPFSVYDQYQKRDELIPSRYERQPYRVIIGLREDYLAQLESLKKYLPSVLKSRYRILQMTVTQAMQSALKSAGNLIEKPVAKEIIKKLPGITDRDFDELAVDSDQIKRILIEPFLLSIICFQINEKRIERGLEKFTHELVSKFEIKDAINSFYKDAIKNCIENISVGIEDSLLTLSGYRRFAELEELKNKHKIDDASIEILISKRIIRKEVRDGVDYVELIHDVLVDVIKENRDKRVRKAFETAERRKRLVSRRWLVSLFTFTTIVLVTIGIFREINFQKSELKNDVNKIEDFIAETKTKVENAIKKPILEEDPTLSLQIVYQAKNNLELASKSKDSLVDKSYGLFSKFILSKLKAKKFHELDSIHQQTNSFILKQANLILAQDYALYKTVEPKNSNTASFDKRFVNMIFPEKVDSDSSSFNVWRGEKDKIDSILNHGTLSQLVFVGDFNRAMALYKDGSAGYWDVNGDFHPLENEHPITSIAPIQYKVIGYKMLTVMNNSTIMEWNLDGTMRKSIRVRLNDAVKVNYKYKEGIQFNDKIVSIAISPNRSKIFTASNKGTGIIWPADTSKVVLIIDSLKAFILTQSPDTITCSTFSKNGLIIATGSVNGTVKLWSAGRREVEFIKELKGHTGRITSVAFSASDRFLYTGSMDGSFRKWYIPPIDSISNLPLMPWIRTESLDSLFVKQIIDIEPYEPPKN